jgi:hypothetical protein
LHHDLHLALSNTIDGPEEVGYNEACYQLPLPMRWR